MSEKKRKYIRYVTKDKLDKVCDENKMHINKYFSFKNMKLSDSTKKSYESDFNQWLVFINEKYSSGMIRSENILEIVKDEEGIEDMVDLIEDYIAFCVTAFGNNERRIQRRMSSISSFFLYLIKKRKIKINPLDFLERPSLKAGEKPQVIQTLLTKEQVEEIRKGLKKIGNIQLELYFELSLSTMARVNAVKNIRLEQIDFEARRINRVMEKEGKEVTLYFSIRTLELIKEWLKYREKEGIDNPYLFLSKNGKEWQQVAKNTIQSLWIKKIGNIVNIPELHPHDLRHSGSNLLYQSGMKLEKVSELLNHSGTDVTQKHYLQKNHDKLQEEKDKYEI